MSIRIERRKIEVNEFQQLRATTGWSMQSDELISKALDNDLFSVVIYKNEQITAMGRVIGDGVLYFYIQDVVVHPDFHNQGFGTQIMVEIHNFINNYAPPKAFIGLMAAKGVQAFYENLGYKIRPLEGPGMFRIKE